MRPKEVPPSLASDSFRCPRCGALAHQTWFKVYAERFQGDDKPSIIDRKMVEQIKQDEKTPPSVVTMLERMSLKQPILHSTGDRRAYTNLLIENAYLSHCYSCDGITILVSERGRSKRILPALESAFTVRAATGVESRIYDEANCAKVSAMPIAAAIVRGRLRNYVWRPHQRRRQAFGMEPVYWPSSWSRNTRLTALSGLFVRPDKSPGCANTGRCG
jgi:hypothetical protein